MTAPPETKKLWVERLVDATGSAGFHDLALAGFGPDVATYWSRRYAERIWGEFFILARRNVGKVPANFSANFDGEF